MGKAIEMVFVREEPFRGDFVAHRSDCRDLARKLRGGGWVVSEFPADDPVLEGVDVWSEHADACLSGGRWREINGS